MSVVSAILVSHDPKWTAPVVLVTCPSCGREAERTPGSWSGRSDGTLRLRLNCWPLSEASPPCYRTFDAVATEEPT